jgi:PilZ domain
MPSEHRLRKYKRVSLPKGALVAWERLGKRKVSVASVLALGGLFISTSDPAPEGDVINLLLQVPGGEVRARAIVRSSIPGEGMGIQFTAMAPDARARLNLLMERLTRI